MTSASNMLLEAKGVGIAEAAAALKQTQPSRLVILAGAGISVAPPAACPTFNGLLQEILASATTEYSELIDLANAITTRDREKPIKPELLFQVLHANMGAGILGCLDTLLLGQPNVNHRAIARLGAQGASNIIITTNFDTYIEDALAEAECGYETHLNSTPRPSSPGRIESGKRPDLQVVKLHGSLEEPSSIRITLRQAGRQLRGNIEPFFKHVMTEYTVLVIGYSGNDDDIFPILKSSANSAKCVFWVLRKNEDTLKAEHNVEDFARTCTKCKLVLAGGQDLLPLIVSESARSGESKTSVVSAVRDRRMQRLAQWASGFSANAWTNCFCELLLLLDPKEKVEVAGLILARSSRIAYQCDDPLIRANALRNCGLALIARGDRQNGIEDLSSALQRFVTLGRPREIVEIAALLVENTSAETSLDKDNSPLTTASLFVLDEYSQGLFNYAAGLELFRESKLVSAEKCLLIAGGYALEAGDTVTLGKSVAALEKLYANPAEYMCPALFWKQLPILRNTLDSLGTPRSSGQTDMLRLFQAAVRTHKWLFFKLDAAKCLGITCLCWLVALAIWRSPVGAIKYSLYGTAGYAISKIGGILKKRRYVDIDRA